MNFYVSILQKEFGKKPSKRYSQSCVLYKDELYLFGGYDENSFSCNDLWKFSFQELEWENIKVEIKPPSRFHHKPLVIKDKMYIFGGLSETLKNYNDLWEFDFSTQQWSQKTTSGTIPNPKYGFEMFEYQENIFIYGGCDNEFGFEEVHYLDLKTFKWKNLPKEEFPFEKSSGSVFSSLVIDKDILYFYGGFHKEKQKNSQKLLMLSDDLIIRILSFLDIKNICNISCVSKNWNFSKLSNDDFFWKEKFLKCIKIFNLLESNYQGISYKNAIIKIHFDIIKEFENYTPFQKKHIYYGDTKFLSTIKMKSSIFHPPIDHNGKRLKCNTVGDVGIGKTCLIMTLTNNSFPLETIIGIG